MFVDETDSPGDDSPGADESTIDPVAPSTGADDSTVDHTKETPDGQDTAAPEGEDAAPDGETTEDETTGEYKLTPEDLEELASAYREDITNTKAFKDEIARQVQEQVNRQVTEATRGRESSAQVQALVEQGKQAVTQIGQMAQAAKAELEKASREEEFSSTVFDPVAFDTNLRVYGQAIVADVAHNYDRAIEDGLFGVLQDKLPQLTEAETTELQQIVATAQRMEGDPNQAQKAKAYFVSGLMNFVAEKAMQAGALNERERGTKRTSVAEKVAKANATKSAAAKLAAQRGNPPPASVPAGQSESDGPPPGNYNSEYYLKMKKIDALKANDYAFSFDNDGRPLSGARV